MQASPLDQLTGGRGDPAVRLGLFFQRHADVEVDGLVLERVRQEQGVWTYRIATTAAVATHVSQVVGG